MKFVLVVIGPALILAGCQNTGVRAPLFGRSTVSAPATQPAGSAYYPVAGAANSPSGLPASTTRVWNLSAGGPAAGGASLDPRGLSSAPSLASISRDRLSQPRQIASSAGEEPIRIADPAPSRDGLAAILRLRGLPTTDVSQIAAASPATLQSRIHSSGSALAPGYVELSQLPDAPDAVRRAARAQAPLR